MLLSWLTLSLGLYVTGLLVPGFQVRGARGALVVGAVFGLLHYLIGWLLFVVIGISTLFLGFIFDFVTRWFVTAVLLKVTDALSESITIDSFRTSLVASAVLSVLGALTRLLLHGGHHSVWV